MSAYVCTIKKSNKRATWQIKDGPRHELVPMHGLQSHLDEAVAALGGDPDDHATIWDFVYDTVPLPNFSFQLRRLPKGIGGTVDYSMVENRLGQVTRDLWFPARIFTIWTAVPEELWVRIERSWYDRTIFLSPYEGGQ